jgi:hypothetical protein
VGHRLEARESASTNQLLAQQTCQLKPAIMHILGRFYILRKEASKRLEYTEKARSVVAFFFNSFQRKYGLWEFH